MTVDVERDRRPPLSVLRRLPRWVLAALGVACVVLGLVLALNPFASLTALVILLAGGLVLNGAGEIASAAQSPAPPVRVAIGVAWVIAGIAVLALPGLTIVGIAAVVGAGLAVSGLVDLVGGVRGTGDERFTALVGGIASIVFGVLALSWPDVTLFVVAVLLGARMVVFGVRLIVAALRSFGDETPDRPGGVRRWWRPLVALLSLAVALGLLGIATRLDRAAPRPDAFYSAPQDPPEAPGTLLRTETFTRAIPDGAQAWRVLYTTTRDDGQPAVASAIVVAPSDAPDGPRPVIAWAHGTTGAASGCAPSLLEDPFEAGAMPALDRAIANGWVVVATDYVGLGTQGPHPYLIGQGQGRSVLDAVRAAGQTDEVALADQVVVWGHSQGGHAALWTGILAPTYAEDVDLVGVVAMAPASDLPGLVGNLDVVPGGSLFASYVLTAYSEVYDDVAFNDYVRPSARILVRELAGRCLAEPRALVSVVQSLAMDRPVTSTDPATGSLGERLTENVPTGPIPVPLLIAQGETDLLVLPSAQEAYAAQRCEGGEVEYRTYPERDHLTVVADDSPLIPDLLAWTQDRLDGRPAASTC